MNTDNPTPNDRYWLCPLYSFDCDCESIDLVQGIQIKQISLKLADYLHRHHSDWFWSDPSDTKCMVVLPYSVATRGEVRRMLDEGDEESALLVDLVTAFRLCHEGMVAPGPLISAKFQDSEFSISGWHDILSGIGSGPILTSISKDGADPFASPEYKFYQSDILLVNELMKNLIRLHGKKEPDNLSIALKRFNSSYHGSLEDRLIDQMVAFEFLYLGYEQELKYRLALRVAFLLGKDDEGARKDIFNKMSKAYKLRSDIVHGNKQVEWFELEEIITQIEEYLRQSIRRFLLLLSEGHSLKSLRQGTDRKLATLEENILSNGTLLALNDFSKG